MSTRGVEARMREAARVALENFDGVISGESFNEVVEYASRGPLTDGERTALLHPHEYLERARNIDVSRISFSDEAREIAAGLVGDSGLEVFPSFGAAQPAAGPVPDLPSAVSVRQAYANALAKGKDLGSFENWKVSTAGADIQFATSAAGKKWPALVLDKRAFTDPEEPRSLVSEYAEDFTAVTNLEEFQAVVDKIIEAEADYFAVKGVSVDNPNENYGIRNLRRKAFVKGLLHEGIHDSQLSFTDKISARGIAEKAAITLIDGIDFEMKVGSHTNYWPYWDNYAPPLEKMLEQQEEGSAAYFQIKNRLNDIYRRKTSNERWMRKVDERNFEASVQMALVYSPQFSIGDGHRVSLSADSTIFEPKYELLRVKPEGLPEEFQEYAGFQVYRDTDEEKTLRFDFMGDGTESRAGNAIAEGLASYIESSVLFEDSLDGLSLRKFAGNEKPRMKISMDWGESGSIKIAKTNIGWWGHCHNEAPMNAMDIDPQKRVTFYRADRGVDVSKALREYTTEDAWDVAGALVADHEGSPEWAVASTGRATYGVDKTSFVGVRNDGAHYFKLKLPSGTTISLDGEIKSLMDAEGKSYHPKSTFRENIEQEDGSFIANPLYVSTVKGDNITIDVKGATMRMATEYFTFDENGYPIKKEGSVSLFPSHDEFMKVSESIKTRYAGVGGEVLEHYFNPKTQEYKTAVRKIAKENDFKGEEISTTEPVKIVSAHHTTESEYDSPVEIYEYFMDNPGLPKTYDTSSDSAVWNYPICREKLSLIKEVTKDESGISYTYRTFSLDYDSMGGPNKEQKFILKFNEAGQIVDACSLDPMPDFAYRNDHWVSAPLVTDSSGRLAFNVMAFDKGYLLGRGGSSIEEIETSLWETEATILYASLTDETAAGHAYLFETVDGKILSFDSKEDFEAAVEADKKVRGLAGIE